MKRFDKCFKDIYGKSFEKMNDEIQGEEDKKFYEAISKDIKSWKLVKQ